MRVKLRLLEATGCSRAGPMSQPHVLGGYFLGCLRSFAVFHFLCFPELTLLLYVSGLSSEMWEASPILTDKDSGTFIYLGPDLEDAIHCTNG